MDHQFVFSQTFKSGREREQTKNKGWGGKGSQYIIYSEKENFSKLFGA